MIGPLIQTIHAAAPHFQLADVPSPTTGSLPGTTESQFNSVLGWVKYLGLAAVFVGLFMLGGKMALNHRNGTSGEHLGSLGMIIGALVLIGSASSIVGFFG
jgi:hypothetical protein